MMTIRTMTHVLFLLGAACSVGLADGPTWGALRQSIQDKDLHISKRLEACREASKAPTEQTAREMLEIAAMWASQLNSEKLTLKEKTRDKEVANKVTLLWNFLTQELPRLKPYLRDHQALLDFLTTVATKTFCTLKARYSAIEQIVDSDAPTEARHRALLQLVSDKNMRKQTELSTTLICGFDSKAFPALREMVRGTSDPNEFNYAATAILAHYGDKGIMKDLKRLQNIFLEKEPVASGMIGYYIWQINIQYPPTKLLEFISMPELAAVADSRPLWALRRAVELRLDAAELRMAILTRAEKVVPSGPHKIRPGVSSLKQLGLELGVLKETDLPDVTVVVENRYR